MNANRLVITADVVANGLNYEANGGRTLGDLKIIGQLPESVELNDDYAALIIRTENGMTSVSRSINDEVLVKTRGFAKAMEALAAMFERPVRVAADYGVSGGAVPKVIGTYGEQFAKPTQASETDGPDYILTGPEWDTVRAETEHLIKDETSEITPATVTLTPAMVATLGVLAGTDGSLHGGTTSGEVIAAGGNAYSLTKAMGLGWVVRREPAKGAAERRSSPTYTITPVGAAMLSQVAASKTATREAKWIKANLSQGEPISVTGFGWSAKVIAELIALGAISPDDNGGHFAGIADVRPDEIVVPIGTSECACQDIWKAGQSGAVVPVGGIVCPSDGSIFVPTDTEASEAVHATSGAVVNANSLLKSAQYEALSLPTNTPVIAGHEWKRHVLPGESVWAGSTYQLIIAGTNGHVIATVKYRDHGLWTAQGCSWGSPGLTVDYWGGEPLANAFANVVKYIDFLGRAKAAGLSGHDVFRADWRTWVAPVCVHCGNATVGRDDQVTPFPHECATAADLVRFNLADRLHDELDGPPPLASRVTDQDMRDQVTAFIGASGEHADRAVVAEIVETLRAVHGTVSIDDIDPEAFGQVIEWHLSNLGIVASHDETWQRAEDTIWAGTDQVVRMRFPRKLKKAVRKEFGVPRLRPISAKRARVLAGR